MCWLIRRKARVRAPPHARHQNKIQKVFLRRFPLTRRNVSSHSTEWILFESPLPFITQGKLSNECTWRRISLPSQNFYKSHKYTPICIMFSLCRRLFITEIFKPQLFSSHATCLHTRLTEFFLNRRCLLYRTVSCLMKELEGECLCLREISINLTCLSQIHSHFYRVLFVPTSVYNRDL